MTYTPDGVLRMFLDKHPAIKDWNAEAQSDARQIITLLAIGIKTSRGEEVDDEMIEILVEELLENFDQNGK